MIIRIFLFVHFEPDIFLDAHLFTFIKLIINSLARYLAYNHKKKGRKTCIKDVKISRGGKYMRLAMCVNSLPLMANSVAGYSLIVS